MFIFVPVKEYVVVPINIAVADQMKILCRRAVNNVFTRRGKTTPQHLTTAKTTVDNRDVILGTVAASSSRMYSAYIEAYTWAYARYLRPLHTPAIMPMKPTKPSAIVRIKNDSFAESSMLICLKTIKLMMLVMKADTEKTVFKQTLIVTAKIQRAVSLMMSSLVSGAGQGLTSSWFRKVSVRRRRRWHRSQLRSARTLLSRVRAPPPATAPEITLLSTGHIYKTQTSVRRRLPLRSHINEILIRKSKQSEKVSEKQRKSERHGEKELDMRYLYDGTFHAPYGRLNGS
ncbi:hypothetical protein PoB_001950000 [Plakobranchus ocellatus]|uniref:Uncharacterized protein n=1 Tax=Plakobranchus ocellatus TaxID=259542 RepID=A0AAV3ZEJ4_9GAST|nr:hypothetical protein PoB_001950000 [Plakobranchus ocellatus]